MSHNRLRGLVQRIATALLVGLGILGCGSGGLPSPPGAIAGQFDLYDYSPSVVQTGTLQQIWWCGQARNPSNPQQMTDTIQYQAYDSSTHARVSRQTVLAETARAWDSAYTCNPRVIKGVFTNPLSDGQTYTYEMFYVATTSLEGTNNSIGAAFSNDGAVWHKYKDPVIPSTTFSGYGVGQPAAYNRDGKSGIVLFYEDTQPATHHVQATSDDGIHFTVQGTITTAGLDNPEKDWGDMGFDPSSGYWYAAFNRPLRAPSTTGGVIERGQSGVEIWRIPDTSLRNGHTPWQRLKTIDTNLTGYESNFLASLLHDGFGNLNVGSDPNLQLFLSASNPQPAWDASPLKAGESGDINTWDIVQYVWNSKELTHPLTRYKNSKGYETTTGWIDAKGGFAQEKILGHLYDAPQNGANVAFYGCKAGSADYFLSQDATCGGARVLGIDGFGYALPVAGQNMVTLYACTSPSGTHFGSTDPACEGSGKGILLGYALP